MVEKEAFVYCWTDHKTNKLYVGSHKGSTNDGYICSSKIMKEQYNERPEDFTRQIIAEGKYEDIRKLESKILDIVDARLNEDFYNQHNGNGDFYLKGHSVQARKKISIANTGKKRPDVSIKNKKGLSIESRKKISKNHKDVSGSNNPLYGKKHTEESKQKMSKAQKGKLKGHKASLETKQKMSIARKLYWERRRNKNLGN